MAAIDNPGIPVDFGGGLFLVGNSDWETPQGDWPRGSVGDSTSERPDCFYGPAAWDRGIGPASALVLLEISGDGWEAYRDSRSEDLPATFLPGKVEVTVAGRDYGLSALHGKRFVSSDELKRAITALRTPSGAGMATYDAAGREAVVAPFLGGMG